MNRRFFARWSWRTWLLLSWTVVVLATVLILEIQTGSPGDSFGFDARGFLLFSGFIAWGVGLGICFGIISLISAVARWVEWRFTERELKARRAKRDADRQAVGQ